ncbi:MAG: heavy-metal-associated domain-containing protein [Bacteroidia bacterium]|nr:heavy-metal-associated domain-containing protein [Bacteroidia bacterium]
MRKIVLILIAFVSISSVAFAQEAKKQKPKKNQETVEFVVTNEDLCNHCVKKINNNIAFEKGVTGLDFDQPNRLVKVTYRKDRTSPEKLKAAFAKIKMEVEEVKPENSESKSEK